MCVCVYPVEAGVGWGIVGWRVGCGRGLGVGGVLIGPCYVSASGFRWRAPSSSSGAGSSCSCKAPVLRQPMKGVWKLSIMGLPSRSPPMGLLPSLPLSCFLASSTHLSTHPSCRCSIWHPPTLLDLPAMYSWLFSYSSLTSGNIALGLSGSILRFLALNFVK